MTHPLSSAHSDLATTLDLVDRWIGKRVHDTNLPGLAAAVVHDGELLWGRGYGLADQDSGAPVTLDTRFRIASITKTFTSVALLQLRDQGKLRLDDPVSDYLDWFDLRFPGAPAIRLYHLLTHTSGLPRDATVPHWTDDCFQSWDELVETTRQRAPTAPPLARFGYSNLGFSLLGGVVEAASGMPWDAYLQARVLEPLGMRNTLPLPRGDEKDL
ncbi:MAG TPA: serine hydrolase domain-containing protein, partial [Trueperaceae bacterium]